MKERMERITVRALAILEQSFDLIDKRDPAAALAAAYKRDPLAYLERVSKLCLPAGEPKNANTLNSLFVLAAKQAAQLPPPTVLDAEVAEVPRLGVQPGYKDSEDVEW